MARPRLLVRKIKDILRLHSKHTADRRRDSAVALCYLALLHTPFKPTKETAFQLALTSSNSG